MASFVTRKGRIRALIRRAGRSRCATFSTRAAAHAWAEKIERELDQIRATGVIQPGSVTIAQLIDRYVEEVGGRKSWGRSKTADLARLRRDLGHHQAARLTTAHVVNYFQRRTDEGAGPVVVQSAVGYLAGVFKTARSLWHLDVPVSAVTAGETLGAHGMAGAPKRRDRRVSDAEIAKLMKHFRQSDTDVPMVDIVRFCVATGMRIFEVCRLQWADFDAAKKTVVIRDRKHPTDKIRNDQIVPLLAATGIDTMAIVKKQPKDNDRIFAVNPRTVAAYFTRAVQALGLKDLHRHDLPHEAISRLFAAGYRIEQVALVSGHRDWAMPRRYTHVKVEELHKGPT
jgi:integrase